MQAYLGKPVRNPNLPKEIRRVAYVTTIDSTDINNWSGILLYLHDALASVFPEVVRIGPLKSTREPLGVARRLCSWARKQDHPLWLTQASAKGMARQVEAQLAEIKPDAVFSVWHPQIAYLRTQLPVFMFQDSPFEIIQPLYEGLHHLTPGIMKEVQLVERLAAKRCTGIVETSDWAASEARKLWRLPDEKVASIPFGANIESRVEKSNLEATIQARRGDAVNLLWLGKEWDRKGGDIAVDATKQLNARGIKAILRVVGCEVPEKFRASYVDAVGFIDKKTPEGLNKLENLLVSSHALILPTRAEAFGIVFLEAAANALPSIAPNVMGVGSAVLDGKTGKLLPKDAPATAYADAIHEWVNDPETYEALASRAFHCYHESFTWQSVAERIRDFMQERVCFRPG